MSFQLMKNDHLVVVCAQCCLGPQWLQIELVFFGTGFEVLTVMRIHNAVWVRTLCSLVHGYECFAGPFWVCLHRQLENGGSTSRPKPQYPPVRLHGSITRKTNFESFESSFSVHCITFPSIIHSFYLFSVNPAGSTNSCGCGNCPSLQYNKNTHSTTYSNTK
jgi:hypothetical protein